MTDCPLCHKKTRLTGGGGYIVACESDGCLEKVVKAGQTEQEAEERYEEFLLEL